MRNAAKAMLAGTAIVFSVLMNREGGWWYALGIPLCLAAGYFLEELAHKADLYDERSRP